MPRSLGNVPTPATAGTRGSRAILYHYMERNLRLVTRYYRAHFALISEFLTGRAVVNEESDHGSESDEEES